MNRITVRSSLMGVLAMFTVMLVVGASLGMYDINESNRTTELVHEISSQVILINDAYKDTTRVRTALMRAYTALRENGTNDALNTALTTARKNRKRSADFLDAYIKSETYEGEDLAMKKELIEAGKALLDTLDKATDALARENAALVEEAAAATQSLQSQASELQQTVEVFKIHTASTQSRVRRPGNQMALLQ